MSDPTSRIVQHVFEAEPTSFSHRLVEKTKVFLLDSLAAILAGSTAAGVPAVVDQVRDWGGKPEADVLVYGGRVPGHLAALVNGMMCHARELDDVHEEASVHVHASVLPAALAAAQIKGGVSGGDLLAGIVVGTDLTCRLGLSIRHLRGWHFSAICGGIGAAAAAARVLGYDRHLIHETIGVAYVQLSGNARSSSEGVLTKRMNPAFAARNALFAAGLAARGITGPKRIFDGKEGFFHLFDGYDLDEQDLRGRLDGSLYEHANLTNGLGSRFEGEFLSMKPYPSCRFTHAPVDAALEMVRKHAVDPASIRRIEVRVCRRAMKYAAPFSPGDHPEISAQFSIPYTVAAAMAHGRLFLDDFTPKAVLDPAVQELAAKVEVKHDPAIKLKVPVTMVVQTADGRCFEETVHRITGSAESDPTLRDAAAKLENCRRWAGGTFSRSQAQALVDLVEGLETVSDVQELVNAMRTA